MQLYLDKIVYITNDLVVNIFAIATNGNFSLIAFNNKLKPLESAGGSYPTYSNDSACAHASGSHPDRRSG
jgi:hypothetical protein